MTNPFASQPPARKTTVPPTSMTATIIILSAPVVAFGFICVFFVLATLTHDPNSHREKLEGASGSEGVRAAGWMVAKNIITPALKSPSSASWPWQSVTLRPYDKISGRSTWLVGGIVEAKNSFGVALRKTWMVCMADDGADLTCLAASFEGRTLYEHRDHMIHRMLAEAAADEGEAEPEVDEIYSPPQRVEEYSEPAMHPQEKKHRDTAEAEVAAQRAADAYAAAIIESEEENKRAKTARREAEKEERDKDFRIWTSTSGTTVDAKFSSQLGKTVTLEKRDGKKIKLPISKLSTADQDFIAAKNR